MTRPEHVGLNLGCGADIQDGMVNADIVALPGVDVVCDLDQPWPWQAGAVDWIKASHVFEHVDNPVLFITEAHRVLRPGGLLDVRVPFWQHPNAFTDPTHRRYCTEHTFDYWVPGQALHEGYGPALGSGPARFAYVELTLNGNEQEEFRALMRKLED